MARAPKPTAAERLEAAKELMQFADWRVSYFERQALGPRYGNGTAAEHRALMDIWRRVQALAGREIVKWSAEEQR